jgi:hypothetical protein
MTNSSLEEGVLSFWSSIHALHLVMRTITVTVIWRNPLRVIIALSNIICGDRIAHRNAYASCDSKPRFYTSLNLKLQS